MKKLGLYMMALLSMGLVGCNQDFETVFEPQTNLPESQLQTSDVSVATNSATAINIASFINEETGIETPIPMGTVSVREGALPSNTILKAEVEFSRDADFANSITLEANSLDGNNEISVQPGQLQDAYFKNITRNPATTNLYIRTVLYTVTGGNAVAIVGKPGENYYATRTVSLTPLNKIKISPAYYVIGAGAGWSADAARTQKFQHSDADVYDDPIFSIVVDAGGDDCWFAIGDDEALNAISADNDWSKLFGTKGASEDLKGTMDFRYNLGGDHSFHVTGAKKIRITLDMMEYSYTIEPVNIADSYYLVGGPGSWSSDKSQKFSHSSADVFDDPVFTYTFEGNGGTGDIWFAFGDADALDAIDNGDWKQLFGTTGSSTDLSGSFDRRYNLPGDNSFCVDGTAKFYRLTVNMSEMTYTITPLNFAEYLWEAGVNNNWGSDAQPLYCGDGNGTYKGFFFAQDADWSGGKGAFKFQKDFNNWDVNYGFDSGDDNGGTLKEGGDNIMVTPGFYYAEINLAEMTYKLTPITTIGIVGPAQAGGWGDDTDMTYNPETRAWEATIELAADELKFRANDGWDINWGGSVDNLTQGGANLKINEAGTYFVQLFATCETKSYCKITKQ
ncbi:MAG: DUF5115 domain-containing protein [Prevotella sp.]|nr:DUF5115 domain-containing protein [Prevotella sp.]